MVDLNDIGKAGLMIQYEDLIAMVGFNIAKQFKSNHLSEKLDSMTVQEVLSSYLNRPDEDYSVWLKKEFDIDIDPKAMNSSFLSMQPNLLYAYKVFPASHKEHQDNLYIYSDIYSPIAEQSLQTYGCGGAVQYIHNDLAGFLKERPNMTFITSSTKSIDIVRNMNVPICLVVCDDYLYTINHFVANKLEKEITNKHNIILRYTSIITGGII